MYRSHGMTLVELLSTLAITAILTSSAVASFGILDSVSANTSAREVAGLVMFSRQKALAQQRSVYICPSDNSHACTKSWTDTLTAYHDLNGNRLLDKDDMVLQTTRLQKHQIRWRAFGNKAYLQFLPTGMTNYHNGTYTICSEVPDPTLARSVIVNVAGRSYFGKDLNQNGIPETASGKDINCPPLT